MVSLKARLEYIANDTENVPIGPEFIATEEDYKDVVLYGSKIQVYSYGIAALDTYCPYKSGQLTAVVGLPNVGKTTTILWMLVQLVKVSKRKFTVHSSENPVAEIVEILIEFYLGKPRKDMSAIQVKLGLDWVRENFRFIRNNRAYTYNDLLKTFYVVLDTGFESDFFIDPYNALKLNLRGLTKPDYNIEACGEFKRFTDITGRSLFLNCHTNTESMRKRDAHNRTPRPMAYDVEGGLPFVSKPDDVLVVHRHVRDPENFMITDVYSDKIRNQKHGGKITGFDSPIQFRFRKDRSGYDVLGSYEEKIASYKETQQHLVKHGVHPDRLFTSGVMQDVPPPEEKDDVMF